MLRFLKNHSLKGVLICAEGIDGSGKSTQIDLLYAWLKEMKQDVILTQWNSSDLISDTTKMAKKKNAKLITTEKDWVRLPTAMREKIKYAGLETTLDSKFFDWLKEKLNDNTKKES